MSTPLVLLVLALAYGARVRYRVRKQRRAAGELGGVAPNRHRRRSLAVVIGILLVQMIALGPPSYAAGCGDAPSPERPGAGMVGAIDPPALGHGDDTVSNYGKYSYAGTTWNVFQPDATPCIPDATATIDTWAGNQLFNVGKNVVGGTNALHYAMLSQDSMLAPLDDAVEQGAKTFYSNVYVEWFALAAIILAVMLFRYIWTGDLASIGRRGMWALAGMWLAASVFALGGVYGAVDSMLLQTTSEIQGGFLSSEAAQDQRNQLPDSLYDNVVYTNWLRGEFGDPKSDNAKKFGPQLLDDQAWTKTDVGQASNQARVDAKANDYKSLPQKLGTDKGFFEGTDGSRTGAGFLAMFQGLAYALFPLLAKAAVLLAQVLIRVLILASPLIGLAAMVMPDILRKVARAAGAVALTVFAFSAMAGAHALLLEQIFDASNKLSLIAQMLLAALITAIFLLIGKPVRRMRQMVELAVGGSGLGNVSTGGLMRRLGIGRRDDPGAPSAGEAFWATVATGEAVAGAAEAANEGRMRNRRDRPEAVHGGPVTATATRLDEQPDTDTPSTVVVDAPRRQALEMGSQGLGPRAGLPPGYRGYTGATPALASAAASRLTDTFPVVENRWDNDDAVVVPSSVVTPSGRPVEAPLRQPRPADPELIGGQQVYVLYRPSSGFEADTGRRR